MYICIQLYKYYWNAKLKVRNGGMELFGKVGC